MDMDRFASFAPKAPRIEADAEAPVRAAQEVLKSLLDEGDDLFIIKTEAGRGLGHQLSVRLAPSAALLLLPGSLTWQKRCL